MIPTRAPNCLRTLNKFENIVIAKVIPVIKVYKRRVNEERVTGHFININNNIQSISNTLPRKFEGCKVFF